MRQTICLGGREVAYELTWKAVKNINIRVRSDGSVGVSAGRGVSRRQVEEILRSREAFLLNALDHFAAQQPRRPKAITYAAGDRVYLLGKPYTITHTTGGRNAARAEGETILLTLKDPADEALRVKTMEAFLKEQCLAVTTALCQAIQPAMAPLGVPMPTVKVRSMTSRWGTCKPAAGQVTFARQLVEAPLPCVEYVVCHELIHFLHPNHSKAFYAALERFCPHWKAQRETLNSYSYRET